MRLGRVASRRGREPPSLRQVLRRAQESLSAGSNLPLGRLLHNWPSICHSDRREESMVLAVGSRRRSSATIPSSRTRFLDSSLRFAAFGMTERETSLRCVRKTDAGGYARASSGGRDKSVDWARGAWLHSDARRTRHHPAARRAWMAGTATVSEEIRAQIVSLVRDFVQPRRCARRRSVRQRRHLPGRAR